MAPGAAPGTLTTKWNPVLERMRADPGDPACGNLLQVLSSPSMTSLARCVYSETAADPGVLLDGDVLRAARTSRTTFLTASSLPPSLGQSPSGRALARRSPHARDAGCWLSFLARHLAQSGTRDLEWWRLETTVPPLVRWLPSGLSPSSRCARFPILHPDWPWPEGADIIGGATAEFVIGMALVTARRASAASGVPHDSAFPAPPALLRRLCSASGRACRRLQRVLEPSGSGPPPA